MAEALLYDVGVEPEFLGGLLDEGISLAGRVQLNRVNEEARGSRLPRHSKAFIGELLERPRMD